MEIVYLKLFATIGYPKEYKVKEETSPLITDADLMIPTKAYVEEEYEDEGINNT